jgi:uncharacterized protein YegL
MELIENNYAVLFNLDMSGSMAGDPWKKVCAGTQYLLNNLGEKDFAGGMVFNDKCTLLPLNQIRQ